MKFQLNLYHFIFPFLTIFSICNVGQLYAQEIGVIQSKYYSSLDYQAGTQNWAIVQDARGVMYFGNVNGVLEFDGENWKLIKVANESSVRSLSIDDNGVIYVGGYNELGYLLPNSSGEMMYNSLLGSLDESLLKFGEVWDINCYNDTVFVLSDRYLFRYINGKFEYWESPNEGYYLTHNLNNELYIQELGVGLMKFENDTMNLIKKGDFFSEYMIHSMFSIDNGFLICTRSNGLFTYTNLNNEVIVKSLSKISPEGHKLNEYFKKHSFYHGVELPNGRIALGSITGEVLIINSNWNVVDIINHETTGIKSPTLYLYFSENQYLWLALDNGISLVEVLSPLRYWNEENGLSGVITDIARLRDTLYISTGSGVFYTTNSRSDSYNVNDFLPVEGNFEQAWEFKYFTPPINQNKKANQNKYSTLCTKLLVATRKGLYEINGNRSTNISQYEALLRIHQCKSDSSKLILGLTNGVAILEYQNGIWEDKGYKFNIDSKINGIDEDSLGNLWFSSDYIGLYRISNPFSQTSDSTKVDFFDTTHGLPSVTSIRVINEFNTFLFYVDGNYFTYNDSLNRFEDYEISNFYDSSTKTQTAVNDSLAWERVWEDIVSYFYVTHPEDSIVWFSTSNSIFRFEPGTTRDYFKSPSALISKVIASDSVLFTGTNIRKAQSALSTEDEIFYLNTDSRVNLGTILKYKDNSLTFFYTLPFYEGEKPNQFAFWLNGYDKNWSEWSDEVKKEYTNLPPGEYVFKVKAKNIYGIESDEAEFVFEILPPWYRTYLAYIGYALFTIFLIYLIVRFYTYRLILEKDKLEVLVKERTQEILIQKEEIIVQSEHLKEANDWISAKNVELEAQKSEIEKKKNQLEISDATKNKFFRIIAHDLRNPISTVVNTTGHIISNIQDFDKEKTKRFVEELNKLSLTTYNLLENLLDWSTSQMGEIKFNPTTLDLRSLLLENIELVKSKIDSKDIKLVFSVPEPINVIADENMLYTILRNLISNAVKFTKDKGVITISTKLHEGFCYLTISDDGIGISKENLKNLFKIEKDVRTPGTRNERGSGLGLILCKEFIEYNGGKITVESEPEKGSRFTVSIKLA